MVLIYIPIFTSTLANIDKETGKRVQKNSVVRLCFLLNLIDKNVEIDPIKDDLTE